MLALLVLVPIAGIGGFGLLQNERDALRYLEATAQAQIASEEVLLAVVDEETGVRGYAASRQKVFLEPYRRAEAEWPQRCEALRRAVAYFGDPRLNEQVASILAIHQEWQNRIAVPLLASKIPRRGVASNATEKAYVDRIRADSAGLEQALATRYGDAERRAALGFARVASSTLAALLVAGGAILGITFRQHRASEERRRDHHTIEALQRAFVNRWQALPQTSVGTAYVSATRESAVGGDLFNVRRIGPDRGLILIGDVAGKGVDAAVDTAFIRYATATLSELFDDPGNVLERFNRQYAETLDGRDGFVVLFLAFVDLSEMRLRYASGGHAPAWLLRSGLPEQLHVTGPVLGVMQDEPYRTESIDLMEGDVLVLATDGLTEARDRGGEQLGLERASVWLAEAATDEPQELVDRLIARLRAYTGGEVSDDLAVLAVRFEGRTAQGGPA